MTDLERDNYVFPGDRFIASGVRTGHGQGMTLRDWFAGQALTGIAANTDWWACAEVDQVARQAYEIADAMLAARDGIE